jgi:SAM-dependent methyltransferase
MCEILPYYTLGSNLLQHTTLKLPLSCSRKWNSYQQIGEDMQNKSVYDWIITGVKWYVINVVGGILSLGRLIGWLLHDVWCRMRHIDNGEKYIIDKSTTKLWISTMTIFLGVVINIMTIILIIPIVMGLQHLKKRKMQRVEKQEEPTIEAVKDVKQWFDGIIYAAGIDPVLRKTREIIAGYIAEDSKVIDICCGTGALVFYIAKRCEDVTGVDHSSGMIKYADKEKENRGLANVKFIHADATNLSLYQDHAFDYAVLSFTIHEMPPYIRIPVLREATRIAKAVIIVDYMIPMPVNWIGIINLRYEFIAGYDHFQNFLNFRDNRGLDDLLEKAELTIEEETTEDKGTSRIVKAKRARD